MHLTAGRLSEMFGESQLGTDKFLRSLDWHGVATQEVESLSPETHAYYEAYAAGVNAYLTERHGAALSLEYAVLGLQNSEYPPNPGRRSIRSLGSRQWRGICAQTLKTRQSGRWCRRS